MKWFWKIPLLVLLLTSCASTTPPSKLDLSGIWYLTLVNGQQYEISISQANPQTAILKSEDLGISGEYNIGPKVISLVKATQPRIQVLEFTKMDGGGYFISSAPPAARTGIQLLGSSLDRAM